ncbi:MAG TPA: elongation factor P [Patescibacteria group bacterium]|nr:elongation factor P [Patescibacteria group bacterium]
MITINAGNITKGMYLIFKDKPHLVTKTEFMSPGKGSAVMRVKYKSIENGSALEFTYKTSEQVEVADVEKKEMEFLYRAGDELTFMNPQTYDQAEVPMSLVEDQVGYLTPNLKCWVLWYKEKAIGVSLPPNVTLKVTESPDEVAGNRINAPKKTVKLETGATAQVPIFIKLGEKVMIDTTTGEYLGRVK